MDTKPTVWLGSQPPFRDNPKVEPSPRLLRAYRFRLDTKAPEADDREWGTAARRKDGSWTRALVKDTLDLTSSVEAELVRDMLTFVTSFPGQPYGALAPQARTAKMPAVRAALIESLT